MSANIDPRAVTLYNHYIHGDLPRRDFMRKLAGIAGSVAAANALLPFIEPNYAAAQQVAEDDRRLSTSAIEYDGSSGKVRGYLARPTGSTADTPAILVIHENRGLNSHIEDVARRAALAGYVALAPDGLSVAGGAPEDQEAARDLFGKTDREVIGNDVMAGIGWLRAEGSAARKIGTVGFCYGGGLALRCAADHPDAVHAAVCFYGSALSSEQIAKVRAPLAMHYAGEDERINAGIPDFRRELDAAKVRYSLHMYPGTGHGFHNDSSAARYAEADAKLAWQRTIEFFDSELGGG